MLQNWNWRGTPPVIMALRETRAGECGKASYFMLLMNGKVIIKTQTVTWSTKLCLCSKNNDRGLTWHTMKTSAATHIRMSQVSRPTCKLSRSLLFQLASCGKICVHLVDHAKLVVNVHLMRENPHGRLLRSKPCCAVWRPHTGKRSEFHSKNSTIVKQILNSQFCYKLVKSN